MLKQVCCFLDDKGQAIGSGAEYVLTHVDDTLAAGDIPILHSFVDDLKKRMGDHSKQNHWTR